VLRINAVDQDEDPGMYTCNIHCDSTSNSALSYKLEMCVQDAATKLSEIISFLLCNSSDIARMCQVNITS